MYPYGLNDRLQHVGNVSHSSVCSRNNVFNLFHRQKRRNRSHGHQSNSSRTSEITLDLLRNLYSGGQGHGNLHRLLTTLHSARLPNLHKLFTECEQLIVDPFLFLLFSLRFLNAMSTFHFITFLLKMTCSPIPSLASESLALASLLLLILSIVFSTIWTTES